LPDWIEYGVGDNTLALTKPRRRSGNGPTPARGASLQLAFKVSASEVNQCADELVRQGIKLVSPPTGEAPARRTMFFRDPDGNLLEMFGDI
jgi:catechol 2,3-dioxygenase-like lactoylglutathione lyase family enzyme